MKNIILFFLVACTIPVQAAAEDYICIERTKFLQIAAILGKVIAILTELHTQAEGLYAQDTKGLTKNINFGAWQALISEQHQSQMPDFIENKAGTTDTKSNADEEQ